MPSLPIVPTQVTLKGNVGSLDAPRTAQLFTFGPRGQGISLRGSRKWKPSINESRRAFIDIQPVSIKYVINLFNMFILSMPYTEP